MSKDILKEKATEIHSKKLPLLYDSFHPEENEISIKGCILPHYILGVYDTDNKEFIVNPHSLTKKRDWIGHGFDIDQKTFSKFIKTTEYKKYLELIESEIVRENSF